MNKHQKVAVIVWTVDPERNRRFLLRHNKPFDGHSDEWTIVFGGVEDNESMEEAAKREVFEEYSLETHEQITNLNYKMQFTGRDKIKREVHFFAIKVKDLNVKVVLNEESIGYDWMLIENVKEIMKYDDEKKVFDLVK